MARVLRLTLLWLLGVALPLQGVSAATMLACGMGHHEHASVQVNPPHAGTAAHPVHSHVAGASAHDHAGSAPSGSGKAELAKGVGHKCSACAACCLSAVVPPDVVSFEAVELPDLFALFVARTLAAHVTEGLERPPRSFLA